MDEKLAIFFGLLLSDGSIFYDKSKRTYCIQFTNKLVALRDVFKRLAEDCFYIKTFRENKCVGAISLRFFSVEIARYLMRLSLPENYARIKYPHYRKNRCIIPASILSDRKLIAAFLRGFVSGDGSVYANKKYGILRVEIACHYQNLRRQISKSLSLLDIPCRITERSVIVSGFENCKKFLYLVGFLKESLVSDSSSPNYGIAKNSLASLEFPAKLSICCCPFLRK